MCGRLGNDVAAFAQLLTLLVEVGDKPDNPVAVAIETDRGLWVAALRETGRVIYPINPLADSRYRSRYAALVAFAELSSGGLARAGACTILAAAPAPADAAKLTPAPLRRLLAKAGRQRNLDRDVDRLRTVFTDTSLHQPPVVEVAMGIQLDALLRQFDGACAAAEELAEAAAHFEQHPDAAIIASFPGLGNLAGARVLAEIGDDRGRFTDAGGLKAFAGSSPITRSSGKKTVVTHRHIKNRPRCGRLDLGAGLAAHLAGRPPPLRRPPRRRRLESPSPTTPVQQIPRPAPPLPVYRPALQ